MQEGKLIKLLKALSKEEFRNLEDYMDSPFFLKRNKDALLLYRAIKRQYPHFQSSVLLKRRVFKKVYPDQEYADGKMRNLLTKLVKITESYLIYIDNKSNEFSKNKQLTIIYSNRNIYDEFVKNTKRLLDLLEKSPIKDAEHYLHKFTLEKYWYAHINSSKRKMLDVLKNVLTSLHHYFSLERIEIDLDIKNRERIFKENLEFKEVKVHERLIEKNLTYQLKSNIIEILATNDEDLFKETKSLFEANLTSLNLKDKTNIYMLLQNFTLQQVPLGPNKFYPIVLDTYKLGLKHQLLFENGNLLGSTYFNIVTISLKQKEYKWAEDFIEKYEDKIAPSMRVFIKNLCLGFLNYEQQKYKDAINILSSLNYPNNIYLITVKTLQIRSSFKLFLNDESYYNPLINLCGSLEKFLKREESVIESRRVRNLNFIKYIRKITNLIKRNKWTQNKKEEIFSSIRKEQQVALKPWLLKV